LTAALLRGDIRALMKHEKGGYVFEAAIQTAGPDELLALAGGLYQHTMDLVAHPWAGNRLADLTRRLVRGHSAGSETQVLVKQHACCDTVLNILTRMLSARRPALPTRRGGQRRDWRALRAFHRRQAAGAGEVRASRQVERAALRRHPGRVSW
jgi:hypothetical protein